MIPIVHRILSATLAITCVSLGALAAEDNKAAIGYTELRQEFGANLPDGSNLTILQVEAPMSSGAYAVSKTGELSTHTITFPLATNQPTIYSSHANAVAKNLTGTTTSILPGLSELKVSSIGSYDTWSIFLGQFVSPGPVAWDLENHSLSASLGALNSNALGLMDYRIDRDLVTVVESLDNGTNAMSPLWGNCYNTITVGTANGQHARGGTNLEGSGRLKPDLVGTATYTSYATPVVASCAGLLIAETKRTAALAAAKDPRTIKALLMADATKEEFSAWSHTAARPLDPIYGTGQVNINNSYRMLIAGRQSAGNAWRAVKGWDLGQSGAGAVHFFEVPAGQTLKFSTVLTWHRGLTPDANYFNFTTNLAALDLRLRNSDASFALGSVVAESTSPLDNVEHIYCPTLPAGRYALEVVGPAGTTYGLAWNSVPAGAVANTAPTIADLGDKAVIAGTALSMPVAIADMETAAAALTVTATSSNTTLVPAAGLALSGATASRVLAITLAAGKTGTATITVTVKDGGGLTAKDTFVLTVTAAPATTLVDTTDDHLGTVTAHGQISASEGAAKAFDGSTATKWLDLSPSGSWIQYRYANGQQHEVSSYTIASANDHSERDPSDWRLLGSNDGGLTWTTLDSRSGVLFSARKQKLTFTVAVPGMFNLYRLDITRVRTPASANSVQLSEIELLEDPAPAVTGVSG